MLHSLSAIVLATSMFSGDTVVCPYDVSDLTGADRLEAMREAVVDPKLTNEARLAALDAYVAVRESMSEGGGSDSLLKSVTAFVEPKSDGFRAELIDARTLVVVGSPAQQRWVDSFLESWRDFDGLIGVESIVIEVPEARVKELLGERHSAVLTSEESYDLLERVEQFPDAGKITAPRIISFPGARSSIQMLEQRAYIRDYELTLLPGVSTEIADPVIDVLQTGVSLDVRTAPITADRLAVELDFNHTRVEEPIPTRELRWPDRGAVVTIQVPVLREAKAKARFELAQGSAVAIAAFDPEPEEDGARSAMILLLRAKLIERVDTVNGGR